MKGRRGALGQYHASMSNNRGHDFEEATGGIWTTGM